MTSARLVACSRCTRHVRVTEALCPFCGADLAETIRAFRPRNPPTQRLSRAALYAIGVGLAAACGGSVGAGGGLYPDAGAPDAQRLQDDSGGVDCVNGPDYTGCPCSGADEKVCYTGPADTLGVAPCGPGVQRCVPTQEAQYAYGPCEGETLPTPSATCERTTEDAGAPIDASDYDVTGIALYGGVPIEDADVPIDDAGDFDVTGTPAYGAFPVDGSVTQYPDASVPPDDDGGAPDASDQDVLVGAAYGGFPGG